MALEILELLAPRCHISPLCRELFHLLQTPHLQVRIFIARFDSTYNKLFLFINQSLMCAHDAVAQKDFFPHLPDM